MNKIINEVRLYGKNRRQVPQGRNSYWTDIKGWMAGRRRLTGQDPVTVNVTSNNPDGDFAGLSPMRLGPVRCYSEAGREITSVNLEVAWQYAKVYCQVVDEATGQLVDVRDRFLTTGSGGKLMPSAAWFRWRDAAYENSKFVHTHPDYRTSKKFVRRAFPKGSRVAGWYWDGRMLNATEARLKIYARLYQQLVTKTSGFEKLRRIVAEGRDLVLYDLDGYDWLALGRSPADCVRDLQHSFGHGMVLAFLLRGLEPANLKL